MTSTSLEGKHIDLKEVFNLLESTETQINKSITALIKDNLASTKESWLVQSLVDYYYVSRSKSVIEILCTVYDPHDKYLCEKLHDGIRSHEHQLQALQLLLHIVHKQPSFYRMFVTMPVLKVVIKCLKTENNIPVLMTGVTIVTILLPSIPTMVGPYLPDIFEIFNRLASFSIRKPAGNTPDIFLLHLQISVYALFHRLYGMYPYSFLAYLRHFYTKKENAAVFDEVIKGMLERVRLHPQLITGTKEHETSAQRWWQMETSDVVVECAKMSLDPIEGTWEELHCPVIAARQLSLRPKTPKQTTSGKVPLQDLMALTSTQTPESTPGPETMFWSPSEVIGLSTPPPSQRATPAKALLESSTSSTGQPAGPPSVIHSGATPINTPRETPPISEDHDKLRSRNNSRGPNAAKSGDPKRLSSEFGQTNTVPLLTPSSHVMSIPPSPLKTEFTNLPPKGVKTLPVLNAARELQFDRDTSEEQLSPTLPSHVTFSSQSSAKIVKGMDKNATEIPFTGKQEQGEESTQKTEGVAKVTESSISNMEEGGASGLKEGVTVQDTPPMSIDTLSQVIEELDNESDNNDDNDDEVSELTSSQMPGQAPCITAESVAKFMKSVNRIRFNSLTVTNGMEPVMKKVGLMHRSRSCPQFPKLESLSDDDEEVSRSASTTFEEPSQVQLEMKNKDSVATEEKKQKDTEDKMKLGQTQEVKGEGQKVTITMTTTQTTTCDVKVSQCPIYSGLTDVKQAQNEENEFVRVLQQVLSPAPATCAKCKGQLEGPKADISSHFNTFSPPELLDRHIRLGGDIHAKELSKIPIPSTQNVNWTHFGGVPPADEISILRGQLMLLHNQLLYERHKREQHASRNRRLLRKIANANMLEEQDRVKSVQLEQQEMMIRDLHVSLKLLQEQNRKLKSSKDSEEYEKLVQLRSCLQENEDLKNVKKEFNTLLVRQREEQDALNKRLMKTEASLFNAEKELETTRQHATMNVKLREQVIQLQKELLLMGELQQKSQEKLIAYKVSKKTALEQEQAQKTLRAQIKELKSSLSKKSCLLEGCQQQLCDLQESLATKDVAMSELKLTMENLKTSHDDELQSVEDKYEASLRINQALEAQVIQLYMEVEERKYAQARDKRLKQLPLYKQHSDEGKQESTLPGTEAEFRERSGSDPLRKAQQKRPLMRMVSSPGHVNTDTTDDHHKLFLGSMEQPGAGVASPYVVLEESGSQENDLNRLLEHPTNQDASETASLVSQDSTLYPGQQNMLYTDSEDNRSISNRSNRLGDSGFC